MSAKNRIFADIGLAFFFVWSWGDGRRHRSRYIHWNAHRNYLWTKNKYIWNNFRNQSSNSTIRRFVYPLYGGTQYIVYGDSKGDLILVSLGLPVYQQVLVYSNQVLSDDLCLLECGWVRNIRACLHARIYHSLPCLQCHRWLAHAADCGYERRTSSDCFRCVQC